ncbi:TonB-dependent receptor [Asticcacaulis endophyticus]|uniref:TonB-dependent receptor n=1 Tax=Asticcacaulis endophyticus TaxID=1395890 RepID=A0A918UPP4_9CAUL|nr:TonB-dependent receptor [Asticcacaulis endophyticus]GGZ24907.1 TonB-dependent receptor [Asticcacaulis endophyticus]
MLKTMKGGVSHAALILCASLTALGAMAPAYAQDTTEASEDDAPTEVVVVGVRKALQNAQTLKRNADTVVDSITATDIGAFPDKSVAEALQRVAGVAVTRFAAKNDVMRFSAEPSGVVVRGLAQVRSEFNGRDTFSATSGYGLNWSDVSPELMGGVDIYKNQTAELIEGGIAGTINLRTRLPFDQKGRLISGTLEANYGDLAKSTTPNVSALISNRWDTDLGEFGLLGNATYSVVETNSQGTTLPRMMPFVPGTYGNTETVYIPSGFSINDNLYERTREGVSFAAQWASPDRTMLATAQYNRSSYTNEWFEDSVGSTFYWVNPATNTHTTPFTDPNLITPTDLTDENCASCYVPGVPFTFRSDGLFQTGVITTASDGWGKGDINWGTNPVSWLDGSTDQFGTHNQHGVDVPFIQPCINSGVTHGNRNCEYGVGFVTSSRYSTETRVVEDLGLNFVWNPTDKLRFNFDGQYVKASTENYDVSMGLKSFANVNLDLTGEYPKITLEDPTRYNLIGDGLADPRNYSPEWIMDHVTDSKGTEKAFRADVAYDMDSPWLDSVRAGVRYADREQQHQWSNYNWANVASIWSTNAAQSYFVDSGPSVGPAGAFQGYEPGYIENRSISGILDDNLLSQSVFPFITHDVISNASELAKRFSIGGQTDEGGVASSSWSPICERAAEISGSCFTPSEILDVSEKSKAAYVMLKFGGPDATIFDGIGVSGNIGLRVVKTEVTSAGGISFPTAFTTADLNCEPMTPQQIAQLQPGQYAVTPQCLAVNSLDDQAFSDFGSALSTVESSTLKTLPSFNIKFDVNPKWVVRLAASRAMSKPDIGLLRNYMALGRGNLNQADIRVGNPNIVLGTNGQPFSYNYSYTGSTGNPRLRPVMADQFDITVEHYFAAVGSFTANLFYKEFKDYIQNGTFIVPITNNGVTRDVRVTGPVNGDGAALKGLELAYQRYFDFLPAPFDGLGIQANYTRIENDGVATQNIVIDTADGGATAGSAETGSINPGRLEGLSDDAYNVVLMYEKDRIGARLAYNWRSEYLISVNDCCIGLPVWNEAEGFLDASFRYKLTDNIELNVQGSNLLGTETKFLQQVEGPTEANPNTAAKFMPAGWYENDRRIQVGIRLKY